MNTTWLTSPDQSSYYPTNPSYWPTPTTTNSSPISPQQFANWYDNSPVEFLHAPPPYLQPYLEPTDAQPYPEEPEGPDAAQEDTENGENRLHEEPAAAGPSNLGPSRRRRKRSDEDGERKTRSSRACLLCRHYRSKCAPGPSQREPDGDSPCERCWKAGRSCEFTVCLRGKYPVKKYAQLQRQIAHMERIVRILDEAIEAQSRARRRYAYTI